MSGFGSALPHRGRSADLANSSSVAVATAVAVTATAVCGRGDGQRKKLPAAEAESMAPRGKIRERGEKMERWLFSKAEWIFLT